MSCDCATVCAIVMGRINSLWYYFWNISIASLVLSVSATSARVWTPVWSNGIFSGNFSSISGIVSIDKKNSVPETPTDRISQHKEILRTNQLIGHACWPCNTTIKQLGSIVMLLQLCTPTLSMIWWNVAILSCMVTGAIENPAENVI